MRVRRRAAVMRWNMFFAAPWWLLGLPIWLATVLWLLWGRRRRVDVPFLDLWKGPIEPAAPRRGLRPPPPWLAAAMVSMPLALLAAARPAVRLTSGAAQPLTVIVDRGITMSARGHGDARFRELAARAAPVAAEVFGRGAVKLMTVPGGPARDTDHAAWSGIVRRLPPTAADTREGLRSAAMTLLSVSSGPVLVLTDQDLAISDERIVRIAPDMPVRNAGIVHIAARARPAPQVMLRLRNCSSGPLRGALAVEADGRVIRRIAVNLPAEAVKDEFVNLPESARTVTGRLELDDDLPADNEASLVYDRSWPMIEARVPLPPAMQRMVESYRALRRASEGSRRVSVVDDVEAVPLNEAAVVVHRPGAGGPATLIGAEVECADHPVTRGVIRWPGQPGDRRAALPAGEWTPVVRRGDSVLVAVRRGPARGVWTCLDAESWATTPDFVVFWTGVFNWVGEGGEEFRGHQAAPLGSEWTAAESPSRPAGVENGLWPGIYRRADGALRAVNAPPARFGAPGGATWEAELRRLALRQSGQGGAVHLAALMLLMALGCLVAASMLWRPALRRAGVAAGDGQAADRAEERPAPTA